MKQHRSVHLLTLSLLAGSLLALSATAQEHQKLAQTGFQFLSVVSDARAAAMGEAMTTLPLGSAALFFNPAGMAGIDGQVDFSASLNKWIADINHSTVALAWKPWHGDFGVLGLSFQLVDYGDFYGTRVTNTALGYEDMGIFTVKPSFAIGLGYAKQLNDQFSVGGQIRWVQQNLGESMTSANIQEFNPGTDSSYRTADTVMVQNKLHPFVFDFGTQFKTGFKSLVFGMSVRNFSGEVKYASEGFQAPLMFTLGISMDLIDLTGNFGMDQSLYLSVDASHHRDHPEQVKVGLEYGVMKMVYLRAGYASSANDETDFTYGLGVSKFGFTLDYAYTPYGIFGSVQRMTVRYLY